MKIISSGWNQQKQKYECIIEHTKGGKKVQTVLESPGPIEEVK